MIDYRKTFQKELGFRGEFPDCYAFSLHKAGSTLMNNMIDQVCHQAGIPAINIPAKLFAQGLSGRDWENDTGLLSVLEPGRIYYGFRFLPSALLDPSLQLKEKKCVLLVRDPRDALTSQYYSFGGKHFSHALPEKNQAAFLAKAQTTAHMDIDQYVLSNAAVYEGRLRKYKEHLNFQKVLLCRYEDIFYSKQKFLGDIFGYFEISVGAALLDAVAEKNDVRPDQEDITKHIRKGTPGDHAAKLKKETIASLNETFREVGAWYGYDLR
jgi:hypothetical protein